MQMTDTAARPRSELAERLSAFLSQRLGWSFRVCRQRDLWKGIAAAAAELGFSDVETFAEHLVSKEWTRSEIQSLAAYLTVGETYFFRHIEHFELLRDIVIPRLVKERWFGRRELRFWSAGCCTGEEPYTLATYVHDCIPNAQDWDITILGSDINTRFLRKAQEAEYSEWSLRSTPEVLRRRYFNQRRKGRFALVPRIRRMVRFGYLNLADSTYPSVAGETQSMDVILLRNVLIYFTEEQAHNVLRRMHDALAPGGVLIVTATEAPMVPSELFERDMSLSSTLFFKAGSESRDGASTSPRPATACRPVRSGSVPRRSVEAVSRSRSTVPGVRGRERRTAAPDVSLERAVASYRLGRYEETVGHLADSLQRGSPGTAESGAFVLIVKALSNLRRWRDAQNWCARDRETPPFRRALRSARDGAPGAGRCHEGRTLSALGALPRRPLCARPFHARRAPSAARGAGGVTPAHGARAVGPEGAGCGRACCGDRRHYGFAVCGDDRDSDFEG